MRLWTLAIQMGKYAARCLVSSVSEYLTSLCQTSPQAIFDLLTFLNCHYNCTYSNSYAFLTVFQSRMALFDWQPIGQLAICKLDKFWFLPIGELASIGGPPIGRQLSIRWIRPTRIWVPDNGNGLNFLKLDVEFDRKSRNKSINISKTIWMNVK